MACSGRAVTSGARRGTAEADRLRARTLFGFNNPKIARAEIEESGSNGTR
jgi:hypothetical protein